MRHARPIAQIPCSLKQQILFQTLGEPYFTRVLPLSVQEASPTCSHRPRQPCYRPSSADPVCKEPQRQMRGWPSGCWQGVLSPHTPRGLYQDPQAGWAPLPGPGAEERDVGSSGFSLQGWKPPHLSCGGGAQPAAPPGRQQVGTAPCRSPPSLPLSQLWPQCPPAWASAPGE